MFQDWKMKLILSVNFWNSLSNFETIYISIVSSFWVDELYNALTSKYRMINNLRDSRYFKELVSLYYQGNFQELNDYPNKKKL